MHYQTHILPIAPAHFERLASGDLTFLVRANHQGIQPGDLLHIVETDRKLFALRAERTGRGLCRSVGVVLAGRQDATPYGVFGPDGRLELADKVIMSLLPVPGHPYPGPEPVTTELPADAAAAAA